MAEFFSFMRTGLICATILGIAFMIALSLPKSKLQTIMMEVCSWAGMVLCGVYAVSPVDVLPEAALGPFGFIDDLGVVFMGWRAFVTAMSSREDRHAIEAWEERAFRDAVGELDDDEDDDDDDDDEDDDDDDDDD